MTDFRPWTVPYHSGWDSRVKNTDALPGGTGTRFLKCLIAHNGDLVAKSWHRREPAPEHGHMVFTFPH